MKCLVIEDEPKIAELIAKGLKEESMIVEVAGDGERGLELASDGGFDVALLDIMLPGIDGIEVCKRIRARGIDLPVIMLTARDSVNDKVMGLDSGADDYITKPFAFEELLARIRVLKRKRPGAASTMIQVDDLVLDMVSHQASRGGKEVVLSNREYALLEYMMKNTGIVLSRMMIAQHVWGIDFDTFTNTIDVYINYLRNKIDAASERKLIHTVRGRGYSLCDKAP